MQSPASEGRQHFSSREPIDQVSGATPRSRHEDGKEPTFPICQATFRRSNAPFARQHNSLGTQ